jgi:hypothetical protein
LSIFFVRDVVDWCRRLAGIMDGRAEDRVMEDGVAWERLLSGLRTCRVSILAEGPVARYELGRWERGKNTWEDWW